MQLSKEYIEKIRGANSVEELKKVCAEEKISVSDDKLKQYFDMYHSGSAELSDDELNNVAGGACYSDGIDGPYGYHRYLIVSAFITSSTHTDAGNKWSSCHSCGNMFFDGPTAYCSAYACDDGVTERYIIPHA